MEVKKYTSMVITENYYTVEYDDKFFIIDPGYGSYSNLYKKIHDKTISIILTHGHADHIFDLLNFDFENVYLDDDARKTLVNPELNLGNYFKLGKMKVSEEKLKTNEELDENWKIIKTPGHTEGSCCYLFADKYLFTGDTLFFNSIGRTDLPGGNEMQMKESLDKLRTILQHNPELIIHPGHDRSGSAEEVLMNNPFLQSTYY